MDDEQLIDMMLQVQEFNTLEKLKAHYLSSPEWNARKIEIINRRIQERNNRLLAHQKAERDAKEAAKEAERKAREAEQEALLKIQIRNMQSAYYDSPQSWEDSKKAKIKRDAEFIDFWNKRFSEQPFDMYMFTNYLKGGPDGFLRIHREGYIVSIDGINGRIIRNEMMPNYDDRAIIKALKDGINKIIENPNRDPYLGFLDLDQRFDKYMSQLIQDVLRSVSSVFSAFKLQYNNDYEKELKELHSSIAGHILQVSLEILSIILSVVIDCLKCMIGEKLESKFACIKKYNLESDKIKELLLPSGGDTKSISRAKWIGLSRASAPGEIANIAQSHGQNKVEGVIGSVAHRALGIKDVGNAVEEMVKRLVKAGLTEDDLPAFNTGVKIMNFIFAQGLSLLPVGIGGINKLPGFDKEFKTLDDLATGIFDFINAMPFTGQLITFLNLILNVMMTYLGTNKKAVKMILHPYYVKYNDQKIQKIIRTLKDQYPKNQLAILLNAISEDKYKEIMGIGEKYQTAFKHEDEKFYR